MCRLIETIQIDNGKINNLELHNARLNETRKSLFGSNDQIDLSKFIDVPIDKKNKYKCRVLYAEKIIGIEISIYKKRLINSLKLVFSDTIDYMYKYEDRRKLEELFNQREECDDILIVKNKKITDSSFSNLVFSDGKKFYTPAFPLLNGIKRERLIRDSIVFEDDIYFRDLKKFKEVILINAMLDIEDRMAVSVKNIF